MSDDRQTIGANATTTDISEKSNGLGLSARRILEAIAEGQESLVASASEAAVRVMGREAGSKLIDAALCTRSSATKSHAKKAARSALAMSVSGDRLDNPWEDMDVWLAAWIQARAGAIPDPTVPIVTPQTAGKEFGALLALIERLRDDWPTLSLAVAARNACGTRDRGSNASHRTSKQMILPFSVHAFIEQSIFDKNRPLLNQERDAAIAVASAFSLPVGITRMLIPSEFRIVADKKASRAAVILGFVPRQGAKRARAVCVGSPQATVWCAASTPSLASAFVPWLKKAVALRWHFLFPNIDNETIQAASPTRERTLQGWAREVAADATWHGFRVGTARALKYVHQVEGGPQERVSPALANALQMRSNKALRGSIDVYDKDSIDQMLAATRVLHQVRVSLVGGLDSAESIEADAPFDGECRRCGKLLPVETPGALCDIEGCDYVLCVDCFPNFDDPLLCAIHGGED